MKKISHVMTLILTSFSIISGLPAETSPQTTAYAAEEICEFLASSAATGGIIQQRIDALAHCKPGYPTESVMEISQVTQQYTFGQPHSLLITPQNQIDENRLLCPSIPLNSNPEDLQYKLALERCKYGAGS